MIVKQGERICCYYIHCLHCLQFQLCHIFLFCLFEGLIACLSKLQFICDRILYNTLFSREENFAKSEFEIFSREDIFANILFTRKYLPAKISSRENIFSRKYPLAKISSRENILPRKYFPVIFFYRKYVG